MRISDDYCPGSLSPHTPPPVPPAHPHKFVGVDQKQQLRVQHNQWRCRVSLSKSKYCSLEADAQAKASWTQNRERGGGNVPCTQVQSMSMHSFAFATIKKKDTAHKVKVEYGNMATSFDI